MLQESEKTSSFLEKLVSVQKEQVEAAKMVKRQSVSEQRENPRFAGYDGIICNFYYVTEHIM